jgi:hypothetical protein
MIPNTIHLIDITGNGTVKSASRYYKSLLKYTTGWNIKVWTDKNLPKEIKKNRYYRVAKENNKLAFASDVARTWLLLNIGGLYLDNDVELISALKEAYHQLSFLIGYENRYTLSTAFMGSEAGNGILRNVWQRYADDSELSMQSFLKIPNVEYFTLAVSSFGIKLNGREYSHAGIVVKQREVFSPLNYFCPKEDLRSHYTVAVHHFSATWKKNQLIKKKLFLLASKLTHDRIFLLLRLIHKHIRKY